MRSFCNRYWWFLYVAKSGQPGRRVLDTKLVLHMHMHMLSSLPLGVVFLHIGAITASTGFVRSRVISDCSA